MITCKPTMKEFRQFLELSSIHGLHFIYSANRWSKVFWMLVVIGGFTGAGYLIQTALHNWEQSPIRTTTATLTISKITIPNVTVCPPENLNLNVNYDILQSLKIKLDEGKRKELFEYAVEVIQNEVYKEMMSTMEEYI